MASAMDGPFLSKAIYMICPYNFTGLIQDGDVMGMTDKSWIRDEQDEGESVGDKRKREGKERLR